MIKKQKGELIIVCDECGCEEPGGVSEWADFWAEKKRDGWRAKKEGDAWTHTCPLCQEALS